MPKKSSDKILKNFPADTSLEYDENNKLKLTFLNDSKVDGELYAYLLSLSIGEDKETRVYKEFIPSMATIVKDVLRCKSRQTGYNHFNYLLEKGYLKDEGEYYVFKKEKVYFNMSKELVDFFLEVVKEPVIKVYIYLGQRYNYKMSNKGDKQNYVFTIKELCEHLGLDYNHKKNRDTIKNYLIALEKFDLINVVAFRDGQVPKLRLTKFSTEKPQSKANLEVV